MGLPAGGKLKASPKFGPGSAAAEKRRKSKIDEARDVLANVVLCHVPVPRCEVWSQAVPNSSRLLIF